METRKGRLYPPITILAFVPYTLLTVSQAYLVHTAITVLACTAATAVIVSYIEGFDLTLGWIDIAFGFVSLERGRETLAGGLFGLAALLKVFPALVGLYLFRVRSWRGIGGALATGGGLLASALLFGPSTVRRFFGILLDRSESSMFVGGYPPDETYYVTIQRPLSHLLWELWPSAPERALPIVGALVLAPILAYCYLDLETRTDRLVAIHATLTTTVILVPSLRWYLVLLFFSWVSLLSVFDDLLAQVLFVAGGLVAAITDSPIAVLDMLESYPDPLATVAEPVFTVGTLQLYGLLLMLAACGVYKRQNGVGLALRRAVDAARADLESGVSSLRSKTD